MGRFNFNFGSGRFGIGGGNLPSYVTDFFNGFNRVAGDSFTGGPTQVPDNLGVLTTSPSNALPIQGGRLSYLLSDGATLGPELVVNGSFTTDTDWTKGAGWTIAGGVAVATSVASGVDISCNVILTTPGRTYRTTYTVTAVTAGSFRLMMAVGGTARSVPGTYVEDIICASLNFLSIRTTGLTTGSVDNISCKELTPVWLPTAVNGSPLWTSQPIRTRKGSAQKFDSTFLGFLNEPARTNLFLNSAIPVTQGITTTAQAYTISVIGSGSITVSGTAAGVATAAAPLTVTATAGTLTCTVAGALTHGQVAAGTFKTSPITTTAVTATRAATVYSCPTVGVLRPNDFGIWGRVVPSAGGQVNASLVTAAVDNGNMVQCYCQPTGVQYSSRLLGVYQGVSVAYSHLAGIPFEYQSFQSSVYGMGLRLKQDGGAWGAWVLKNDAASKVAPPMSNSLTIGTDPYAGPFAGNFPFTLILQHMDPKGQLEALAIKYP